MPAGTWPCTCRPSLCASAAAGDLQRLTAREREKPLDQYFCAFGGLRGTRDQPLFSLAPNSFALQHV